MVRQAKPLKVMSPDTFHNAPGPAADEQTRARHLPLTLPFAFMSLALLKLQFDM
jgi:hypothetical protein